MVTLLKEIDGIQEYQLDNGLKILLVPNHAAPVVTVTLVYRVGSRNEALGHTGATHFLEHLLFKGSPHFNRQNGNPVASVLQKVGADFNATTAFDRTVYFETLPADQLELALAIESDRMRNAFVRDEDRQAEMTVVRNELERHENEPDSVMWTQTFATAFQAHPYHHPTIGWHSDVEGVPTERIRQFYHDFYYPNNATLVIVGDIEPTPTLDLIGQYFGSIAPSPSPLSAMYTFDWPQEGERRFKIRRPGQLGIIHVAYHVPSLEHTDSHALNVLQDVLSDGVSSRLYQALVEPHLAVYADAYNIQLRDPGLFLILAKMTSDTAHEVVEAAIDETLKQIKAEPPTESEMQRIKNQLKAEFSYSRHGTYALASVLAEFEAMADWRYLVTYLDQLEKVTPQDVQRVANTYFHEDNRTVGWYIPAEPNRVEVRERANNLYPTENRGSAVGKRIPPPEPEIQRYHFAPNGVLLVQENHLDNTVAFQGSIRAGAIHDPFVKPGLASITTSMLKKGTRQYSKLALSEKLSGMGSSISFSIGLETVHFGGRTLSENLETTFQLLFEILQEPTFPEDELEKLKKQRIERLKQRLDSTDAMVSEILYRNIYPKNHPHYQASVGELITATEAISPTDIQSFYAKHFGSNAMIVSVVGDVIGQDLQQMFQTHLETWQINNNPAIDIPDIALEEQEQRSIYPMPDKQNVSILMGHPVDLKRSSPDFFPAMLAIQALGQSSISSRLGVRIRDELGLTYHVVSYFSDIGLGAGSWLASVSAHPDNVEQVIEETLTVIRQYREEGISDSELEDGKSSLIGSYLVGLATNPEIARRLTSLEYYDLGLDYFKTRQKLIERVTREEVNAAIQKYIHPDRASMAIAGAVDNI